MAGLRTIKLFSMVLACCVTLTACSTSQSVSSALRLQTLADAAYDQQQCDSAIKLYQKLSVKLPKNTHSLLRQGNCFVRMNDYQSAQEAYKKALQRDPNFTKAWFNLSYIQAQVLRDTTLQMLRHTDPTDTTLDPVRALSKHVLSAYKIPLMPTTPATGTRPDSSTEQLNTRLQPIDTVITLPLKAVPSHVQ